MNDNLTYCSEGVPMVSLGSICFSLRKGRLMARAQEDGGAYPFFTCDATPYRINSYDFDCDAIIISGNGSNVGYVHRYKGKFNATQRVFVLSEFDTARVNISYIENYLRVHLRSHILAKKAILPYLTKAMLYDFQIPLPPKPVQDRIVEDLKNYRDRVSFLLNNLQCEVDARLLQYETYRDKLLSFAGRTDVRWLTLGEVATRWYYGLNINKGDITREGAPCIRYADIYATNDIKVNACSSFVDETRVPNPKYAEHGDVLFAESSILTHNIGKSVAYLGQERILVGQNIIVMRHDQDPLYLSYALSTTDAVRQKGHGRVKTKAVCITIPGLKKVKIPIPSIEEQREIAAKLDKFHSLTTDLVRNLQEEMEIRQKQYDYYRANLLTFK